MQPPGHRLLQDHAASPIACRHLVRRPAIAGSTHASPSYASTLAQDALSPTLRVVMAVRRRQSRDRQAKNSPPPLRSSANLPQHIWDPKGRFPGITHEYGRYKASVHVDERTVVLGRWATPQKAAVAIDRAVLHFGLNKTLLCPKKSSALGSASPEELRRDAIAARKSNRTTSVDFVGVYLEQSGRWCANITVEYVVHRVSGYLCADDAAVAYDRLVLRYREPGWTRNFPDRLLRSATAEELRRELRTLRKTDPRYRSRALKRTDGLVGITTQGKSGRWTAQLGVNGETFSVHGYLTPKDAAVAYDRLVLHYRGAEWPRNFPRRALKAASAEMLCEEQELRRQTDARYAYVHQHQPSKRRWKPQPAGKDAVAARRASAEKVDGIERPLGVFYTPRATHRSFAALFMMADRSLYLGHWRTPEEAALARDRAALHYYGPSYSCFNDRERAIQAGPADAATLKAEVFSAFKEETSSRFRGVHWCKGAWNASISMHGELQYLGRYSTEEEAAHAWDEAAFKYKGRKAKLNFHPRTDEELGGLKRLCDIE